VTGPELFPATNRDVVNVACQVSFAHLQGILDIDAPVRLKQNITIQLRKLILSLGSSQSSSTINKFFIQVEKWNDPNSIICAFPSVDSEVVSQQLPYLSAYIHKCLPEDYGKIFLYNNYSRITHARAVVIKKGNIQLASCPVPEGIQHDTNFALSKISIPTKHPISPFTLESKGTASTYPPSYSPLLHPPPTQLQSLQHYFAFALLSRNWCTNQIEWIRLKNFASN